MQTGHDVIVVGGSFAGLWAAMQLARARRRVLVMDAGLPRNRFAALAHGFFGQDGKPPAEIIREAAAQLALYPTVQMVEGEAVAAERVADGFEVTLAGGRVESASRLVLATGVRDELPAIPGLQARWGKTVVHCPYCHGYEVRDRRLGVLASHALSIHQALLVPEWGPTTYFTQGHFEPDAEQIAHLAAREVRIERSPVVELLGEAPHLDALRLADGRVISIDTLFVAPKTHMTSPLAEQLGCAFDDAPLGRIVRVDGFKRTTIDGVYAAGDATNAMTNATFASAAGAMAAVSVHQSLAMPAHVS
ncbi:NAD(P)/FAD-dependent oxidoreductase [Paraburkholderia bryophila]|uniref:Thioredoxin reductase n=1 Tax=Paraburkholderia bryophila TaxID=420952 RepID=A0A329CHY9_9BURK|nr:NAD(P)/FAD-dependent oxidoreductase [Paraburkholderia bryophila]RAS34453.1 thioredoxin reductase [Paraburkholderia bryophila]